MSAGFNEAAGVDPADAGEDHHPLFDLLVGASMRPRG